MILFLDVISPVPKFVLIDSNKVIESLHILNKNNSKVSNCLHKKFLTLQKKYNLLDLLECLIVCTGPGSYTSLRVGISFMFGLSYSKKIPLKSIACTELFSYFINVDDIDKTFIIICSGNEQYFACLPIKNGNYNYKILKIDEKDSFENIDLTLYSKCISNFNLPDFIYKEIYSGIDKIDFINLQDKFYEKLFSISKDLIINTNILQPIYISNNKLFD
mgnify:CR=1 FL=1